MVLLFGVIALLAGIACLAIGISSGGPLVIGLSIFIIVIGIILTVSAIKPSHAASKEEAISREDRLRMFYEECAENHVVDLSKEKDRQRAALIAEKHALPPEEIQRLFLEEKQITEQAQETERRAEQEKMEADLFSELTEFSMFYGREKKIQMLTKLRDEAAEQIEGYQRASSNVYALSQQQTMDWALPGGIASGLAGGAAGLATALEIQAKNQAIEENNRRNLESATPLLNMFMSQELDLRGQINQLEQEIDQVKLKLVAEDSPEDCLKQLKLTDTKKEITQTGAMIVTATVKAAKPVFIFGDTPAVIDGTIDANILCSGEQVGIAQMVLPIDGVDEKEVEIKGICLSCADESKEYTIEFSADNLWAMEK